MTNIIIMINRIDLHLGQASTSSKHPSSPSVESIRVGDVFTATLSRRTSRSLVYHCCFRWTHEEVQLTFVDMRHIYLHVQSHTLDHIGIGSIEPIEVKRGECVAFWELQWTKQRIKQAQAEGQLMVQDNNSNNPNNHDENVAGFNIFLLHLSLLRLQENSQDNQLKADRRVQYLHADGVLYSNCIAYIKSMQYILTAQQVAQLSHLQHMKLRNQLLNLHARHLNYNIEDSVPTIAYIVDRGEMSASHKPQIGLDLSNSTATKSEHSLTPILLISGSNVRCHDSQVRQLDRLCGQEVQRLERVISSQAPNLMRSRGGHSCSSEVKSIDVSMSNSSDNYKLSQIELVNAKNRERNSKRLIKVNKLLFVPRLYALIEICPTVQIFRKEVFKLQHQRYRDIQSVPNSNNIQNVREQEMNWYVDKYQEKQEIKSHFNKQLIQKQHPIRNPSPTTYTHTHTYPNINTNTNVKLEQNTGINHKINRLNSKQYDDPSQSMEIKALLKDYDNLLDGQYISSLHQSRESRLGWGQLEVLYHHNSACSHTEAYVDSLRKYVAQLTKHLQFRKVRKMYHFYSAKLMTMEEQYNLGIWHLQQAHQYLSRDRCASILQRAALCNELGRLYFQLKKHHQSIKYFKASIDHKSSIYGQCSLQILCPLYNMLFVLLNCHINQTELQVAIKLLSQVKHNAVSEERILQWRNSQPVREAMTMIEQVDSKLEFEYEDPWRDVMNRVSKVVRNKTVMKRSVGTRQVHEVGFYGEEQVIAQCYNTWLKHCLSAREQLEQNKAHLSQLLQQLHGLNMDAFEDYNRTKLLILKHYLKLCSQMTTTEDNRFPLIHINQFMECLHQIIVGLSQDSKEGLVRANNSRQIRWKSSIIRDLKQIIYGYYKQVSMHLLSNRILVNESDDIGERWERWLFVDYYVDDCPNMCQNISRMSLYQVLEYCLLTQKYKQDYAHIYNFLSLTQTHISSDDKYIETQQMIKKYLLSLSLARIGKYSELITLLGPLITKLQNSDAMPIIQAQTPTEKAEVLLYEWLPKGTVYLYEFQYLQMLAYFHLRNYAQFLKLGRTTYDCRPISQGIHELYRQHQELSKLILKVYSRYGTTGAYSHDQDNDGLISRVVYSLKNRSEPNCLLLKIMRDQPIVQLIEYIERTLKAMTIKNEQKQTKQSKQDRYKQGSKLLEMLTQAVDQDNAEIQSQSFYQLAIQILIKLLQTRSDHAPRASDLLYRMLNPLLTQPQPTQDGGIKVSQGMASFAVDLIEFKVQVITQQKQPQPQQLQLINGMLKQWIPLLLHSTAKLKLKQSAFTFTQHPHKGTGSKLEKRTPQIVVKVVRTLIPWFRSQRMLYQTIVCEIMLHCHSNTSIKGQTSPENDYQQKCSVEEVEMVSSMLFPKYNGGQQINFNLISHTFGNSIILVQLELMQYFESTLGQINKLATLFHQLVIEQRGCVKAAHDFMTDMDQNIANIQRLDHKIERTKAILLTILPEHYTRGLMSRIQQMQQSLHML